MNIILITQDEPFYLAQNLIYLIEKLPSHSKIVGCVVLSPSPYGKRKSFIEKANETRKIFGNKFFLYYSMKFAASKFKKSKRVLNVLNNNDIPAIFLNKGINHKDSINLISKYKPDILISVLGNEIFKKPLIELAPKGCLNSHTALLPKYRGLMPTFWVLKNKEKKTGVSVFYVDEGIDSGDIIVQKNVDIEEGTTQAQLIKQTKFIGMQAIIESVDLIEGGKVEIISNNDDEATYYSMPTKEDVVEFLKKGNKFF